MYILGLTGALASGKTTVAGLITNCHTNTIVMNADEIVHQLQRAGTAQNKAIVDQIGRHILASDGSINRSLLSTEIAKNPDLLNFLEQTLWPAVIAKHKYLLTQASQSGIALAVLDIPLLYKSGSNTLCNSVLVCDCNETERRKRAFARKNMTEKKWNLFHQHQIPVAEFTKRADYIIKTDTSLANTTKDVSNIIASLF